MSAILLLQIDLHHSIKGCQDTVHQCVDSIKALSAYVRNIAENIPKQGSSGLSTSNIITIVIFAITIIGGWIALAFKGGAITNQITNIATSITDMKKDTTKIPAMEVMVNTIWAERFSQHNSPMVLNPRGKEVLLSSGIDKIVEQNYDYIIKNVKAKKPPNAYIAQESVRMAVSELMESSISIKNEVETSAFKSGVDVFAIVFVGALYIRDRILIDLGFEIDDIDKHAPGSSQKPIT